MGTAEQGGNHPVRVLLIGGPKHVEYINLPFGQDEYKFVSTRTLMPSAGPTWNAFPENSEHVYRLDVRLTDAFFGSSDSTVFGARAIFVHEVIANGPDYGGFNLHAVRTALRELEEAKDDLQDATKTLVERNKQLDEWQEKYEKLLEDYRHACNRHQDIRNELEVAARAVRSASQATGRSYTPVVLSEVRPAINP